MTSINMIFFIGGRGSVNFRQGLPPLPLVHLLQYFSVALPACWEYWQCRSRRGIF
jgi:hypothetical protein